MVIFRSLKGSASKNIWEILGYRIMANISCGLLAVHYPNNNKYSVPTTQKCNIWTAKIRDIILFHKIFAVYFENYINHTIVFVRFTQRH
jgi:hypothetical protein